MTNSADPDQLASSEAQTPTDLDLNCLQKQGICGFSRTRVKMGLVILKTKRYKLHLSKEMGDI